MKRGGSLFQTERRLQGSHSPRCHRPGCGTCRIRSGSPPNTPSSASGSHTACCRSGLCSCTRREKPGEEGHTCVRRGLMVPCWNHRGIPKSWHRFLALIPADRICQGLPGGAKKGGNLGGWHRTRGCTESQELRKTMAHYEGSPQEGGGTSVDSSQLAAC